MITDRLWFLFAPDGEGGAAPSLDGFEDEEPDETEIITLGPGEKPPEGDEDDEEGGDEGKVTLTRQEYEALRQGKDPTDVLAKGLADLKDVLGKQQPANLQQQPGESDEEFEKRLEQDLFAEGKSGKAIKEAIQRYGGGQIGQLMTYISSQNKKLLELDGERGPIFKEYRGEIEKFVEGLPPEQQNHPQVWDYAFEQVKGRHVDDIAKKRADERIDELVNARLREMGYDPDSVPQNGGQKKRRASHVESGRGSANAGAAPAKKRKIYATADDKEAARRSGIATEGPAFERFLANRGRR